jgi:plasmid stabilization system protein ParE
VKEGRTQKTLRYPIRRLLLIETRYQIYFDTNEDAGEVVVVAVWHASRDRPPPVSHR